MDVPFGWLDEEVEQDGHGQRHQDGLRVDQGEVDHHTDDGDARRRGSLGINANLCVHVHDLDPAQIASKVSSDSGRRYGVRPTVVQEGEAMSTKQEYQRSMTRLDPVCNRQFE